MDIQAIKNTIQSGNAIMGIEMGSTRIKAVLIDENHNPIASGSHGWENRLENGVWTYHLDDVWAGLQDAYKNLKADVEEKYGVKLTKLKAMGFSAMMSGLFVSSGVGVLVLFRENRCHWKENLQIMALLYGIGVGSGLILLMLSNIA